MGLDIHLFVEYRDVDHWEPVGALVPTEDEFLPDLEHLEGVGAYYYNDFSIDRDTIARFHPPELFDYRNWVLFAVLGHSRNPLPHMDMKLDVIAPPRGLPHDLSLALPSWTKLRVTPDDIASFLLLSEIRAFPWKEKRISSPRLAFSDGQSYAEAVKPFLEEVINPLLNQYKDPMNVRLVYWFTF